MNVFTRGTQLAAGVTTRTIWREVIMFEMFKMFKLRSLRSCAIRCLMSTPTLVHYLSDAHVGLARNLMSMPFIF